MRLALVSLIAIGALTGAAIAQTTDTPPPPPSEAVPPAPPPPAPPAPDAPPPPAEPSAPSMDPAAPVPPPMPVTPPPPPEPPPPPPPPPPPTDPMAIRILDTLERVCIPATTPGGSLDQAARAAGFRRSRDQYTLRQPNLNITVMAISSNGLTCTMQIDYAVDTLQPTIVAVHNWAIGRGMTLRDPYRTTSDFQRDIRSWERDADALVLLAMKRPDGSPVSRNQDRAQVIYQRRVAQ